MPATDLQETSSSSGFGFSILSRRRDQIHSMESSHGAAAAQENELESFQRNVAERFHDLSSSTADSGGELLSIQWIRKLLDAFLCCQEEFKAIVFNNKDHLSKPPMDRHVADFFERSVKALDVCNAIRDGIDQIKQWRKQLEIVCCALSNNQRCFGEGNFRRAKKALDDLAINMLGEKDSNAAVTRRNRSFGRNNGDRREKSLSHFRSLSWSVSRNWSAARQLQAISSNLLPPKGNEIAATNGLNVAVFTMNYVLLFVMWALVAAIPCQDRGLQIHFYATRQFSWAAHVLSLHDRILEESKKRERRNSCGLLREIHEIEKCARDMNELVVDSVRFPVAGDKEAEVKRRVGEVERVCGALVDGLDPLERQVREVFRRIVRSRAHGLDSIG